jgi:hypothetical protein
VEIGDQSLSYPLDGTKPRNLTKPVIDLWSGGLVTFMPANARFNDIPSRWTDGLEIDGLSDHKFFPVVG